MMCLELIQEAQITALQQSNVVDAVPHHRQTGEAQSEGKSIPFFGVDTAILQHVRMNQSARQQFYPPTLLAHWATYSAANQASYVEFKARLDEREVSRPQAHFYVPAKHGAQQRLHEMEQVCNRDVPVHHHAFQLIKRVLMGGIHFFVSEHSPRSHHPNRRTELLQSASLNRRGMGSQQMSIRQPKSVLHIARGMLGGDVQCVKVVVFAFDFWSVHHAEPHRHEQFFEFVLNDRHRMPMSRLNPGNRYGQIDPFLRQPFLQLQAFEGLLPRLKLTLDLPFGVVQQLPYFCAIARRHGTEHLRDLREIPFTAQNRDSEPLQLFEAAKFRDLGYSKTHRFANSFLQVFHIDENGET